MAMAQPAMNAVNNAALGECAPLFSNVHSPCLLFMIVGNLRFQGRVHLSFALRACSCRFSDLSNDSGRRHEEDVLIELEFLGFFGFVILIVRNMCIYKTMLRVSCMY
jgi:hypothetical protein